ncbi:hypothetical protein NLL38_05215 [Corynebacterium accolens]|nr:hypothetical protein [Corynebacterium accolens]WKS70157.1 hypothetical protein NLL40_05895 [Corynebacterium accolens]WKS72311.1 hypothetical protein NLL38_05215 [Corynebacterium accolens]WKS72631.1 hypothetical protein NLL44_06565 [Corynebacterium accolens]
MFDQLSSGIDTIASAFYGFSDALYTFMEPFLNVAKGASQLLGMFQ